MSLPELAVIPAVHIELGGPGPDSMKLAPRSELILEFQQWLIDERIHAIGGTAGGHAGHYVAVFDAMYYPRIRAWLTARGYAEGEPEDPILAEIADDPKPVRYEPGLYGQGGGGKQCRWCKASDWGGPIQHKPSCKWVRARQQLGRSLLGVQVVEADDDDEFEDED